MYLSLPVSQLGDANLVQLGIDFLNGARKGGLEKAEPGYGFAAR